MPIHQPKVSSFSSTVRVSLFAAAITAAGLVAAQEPGFSHDLTLSEIMNGIVMPAANVLWEAAYPDFRPEGQVIIGPDSEEAWLTVREAAVSLAGSTNLMLVPGLPVKDPALITETPEGELAPAAIEALIKTQGAAWSAHAGALHTTAMQALKLIDERDVNALFDLTGGLDSSCTSCHQQFWYPEAP